MNNMLYFVLQDKELYLDEVFVYFNNLPIYFSCISNNQYYLCLCCDYDNQNYVVVESSAKEIVEMLKGKITMRSAFTCKPQHWIVFSGEDTSLDEITLISAPYLEADVLPKEGAKYTVATEKVKQYLSRIERELYSEETFTAIDVTTPGVSANNSQFENFEITMPIDTYTGCFTSKSKLENMTQMSPGISFIYERIDNSQSNVAFKTPSSHNQAFGLDDFKERSIAA